MSDLFESAADFIDETKIEYLIDDTIEKNTIGVMFGESTAGKSFIAVDLGLSVAVGVEIFNNKLAKKGLVLYVTGEGYVGLIRRVKAWRNNYGVTKEDTKLFFLSKKNISFNEIGIREVIVEGKKLESNNTPVSLIIIDTLARHMEGDENSSSDMSKFIRSLGDIQLEFPYSVILIVHHTGHNESTRARGSSALKAAMDFEISVKKAGKGKGKISFTKMKDSEPPSDIEFRLVPEVIGTKKSGGPLTSCIVEYKESCKTEFQKYPTDLELIAIEALINICVLEQNMCDGKYYTNPERWRHEFYRLRLINHPDATKDALKVSYHRSDGKGVSQTLVNKGIVSISEIGVIALREIDQARITDEIKRGNSCGT